ncbi:DUF3558 domain-containing protein [Streptomyces thermodiastaticus]|uniref:DUF3558 domain-containing protein n=1 Tax=Streptomyces thermodiastaticus TaxID=44061 RepID=UPI0016771C86|nr:DUF3558 domain-containing protein [Streptomyces thermodiastaticus]MCE7552522.1 DUF3558 domain-containing protein [Streptomyces thermodiastaticus]GHF85674.1 hypothetical protein GCM10018787_38140 [Streptomyces thermodiastaticus]
MLRKAYGPGASALLAALLLTGCTGGSSGAGTTDGANPDGAGAAQTQAQPGKYRTLPEACDVVGHRTLDSLLPGIKQIADPQQRDQAYEGENTLTYDTDRKVGCRWTADSSEATDHLSVDFERVVSYDNTVSDASQAESVFAAKLKAAGLSGASTGADAGRSSGGMSADGTVSPSGSTTPSAPSSPSSSATDLQSRTLDGLGDEAFLDDRLGSSGSTARQRTVTVAFRTSNVIVTVVYEEQPAVVGMVPDSEEMQDKARKVAAQLADSLGG